MTSAIDSLRLMTKGAYDLQALRIQAGLRLCANFRSRLTDIPPESEDEEAEMSEAAIKVIDELKIHYRRLTDGVARNRTLPKRDGFTGDSLISDYAELVLIDQYIALEGQESKQFRQLLDILETIPIYTEYLSKKPDNTGVGPAMAAVLISYLDPRKARNISSFWKYAGLDVAPDGMGRSRRKEHLVERTYINKNGDEATRVGITYEPFLKTKLMGVLGPSFLRSNSPWRKVYDDYKNRLLSDPSRIKIDVKEWKKKHKAGEDMKQYWPPQRINRAAVRYMVKQFLADLWLKWRELEGLPITDPYNVAKLGQRPHKAA